MKALNCVFGELGHKTLAQERSVDDPSKQNKKLHNFDSDPRATEVKGNIILLH